MSRVISTAVKLFFGLEHFRSLERLLLYDLSLKGKNTIAAVRYILNSAKFHFTSCFTVGASWLGITKPQFLQKLSSSIHFVYSFSQT